MTSSFNGTLYVGVTSNLIQRVWQHRQGQADGFTKQYNVKKLVWYEQHENAESAIVREKRIKEWKRAWKVKLITQTNPEWNDLYADISTITDADGFRPSPESTILRSTHLID